MNDKSAETHLRDARHLSEALIASNADNQQNVASCIESLEQEVKTLRAAVMSMAK